MTCSSQQFTSHEQMCKTMSSILLERKKETPNCSWVCSDYGQEYPPDSLPPADGPPAGAAQSKVAPCLRANQKSRAWQQASLRCAEALVSLSPTFVRPSLPSPAFKGRPGEGPERLQGQTGKHRDTGGWRFCGSRASI